MGSGWSAPIQVTLCPIDSCYSLNRRIRHLERSFHLSGTQGGLSPPLTTLGDFQPLERIITSHYPGGLSLPRKDYHLSPCRFRTVTPICREKWPAVHIWNTSSLTPFHHNNSGLVTCFYLRVYELRALIEPIYHEIIIRDVGYVWVQPWAPEYQQTEGKTLKNNRDRKDHKIPSERAKTGPRCRGRE